MRALIFDGETVRLDAKHPSPAAKPGEAVIRLRAAIVSRLDVLRCGHIFREPGIVGHQCVGVVESTAGTGSAAAQVGQRVVVAPVISCGKCDMCHAGVSRHCRERILFGLTGDRGCLAERFAAPIACMVAVPDSVEDHHAVFAMELSAAMQAARQITIVNRPYITVLGDDAAALLTAQVMSKLNASVRVVGRSSMATSICEKLGIKHRSADEVGRRADQDVVVECTGDSEGLELAMRLVRPRGKVVMKTPLLSRETAMPDLTPVVMHELELIGSFGGVLTEAMLALARREYEVGCLVGRRMSLSDGAAILQRAAEVGGLPVLVEP